MMKIIRDISYKFNLWLDRHDVVKLLSLMGLVLMANMFLFLIPGLTSLCIGTSMYLILCIFVCTRVSYLKMSSRYKNELYNLPEVGDILVIKKVFFYDGGFLKYKPTGVYVKPNILMVNIGTEWVVVDIKDEVDSWKISMSSVTTKFPDNFLSRYVPDMCVDYFTSRKYWTTKSDIRNNKLKKLGI